MSLTTRRTTLGMAGVVLLLLAGCKPDAALQKAEVVGKGTRPAGPPPSAPVSAPPVSGPTGGVTGTVALVGKAPAPVRIDTSMDPACSFGGGDKVVSEQYVVSGGKLANVFVYVKNGPPAAMQAGPTTTTPAVLDQRGCRYTPHVLGVMAGGSVEFRNSDPTMHNIHTMPAELGNQTIDVSQGPRGAAVVKQLDKPEMLLPVRCNNHPWMNAFIDVSPTPFFAVTGQDGSFTLNGLPPGKYTLGAVHEKLGEKTIDVTVAANGVARTSLSFATP